MKEHDVYIKKQYTVIATPPETINVGPTLFLKLFKLLKRLSSGRLRIDASAHHQFTYLIESIHFLVENVMLNNTLVVAHAHRSLHLV